MLAGVLKNDIARQVSINIIRAFIDRSFFKKIWVKNVLQFQG